MSREGVRRPGDVRVIGLVALLALAGVLLAGLPDLPARLASFLDDFGQLLAAATAALTCRWAARRGGAAAHAWTLAGRATGAWAVGQALLGGQHLAGSNGRPSLADLGFALASVWGIRSALAFPAAPHRLAGRGRVLLDGAVVGGSVLFLVWGVVAGMVPDSSSPLALLYPAVDILIITVVLATLTHAPREYAGSLVFVALGLLSLAGTNLLQASLFADLPASPVHHPSDAGFVVGLGLVGLGGALSGRMTWAPWLRAVERLQHVLPYLLLPAVLGTAWAKRHALDGGALGVLFVVATCMAARQVLITFENTGLLAEHRAALDALGESERRYRRIVETAAEGIVVIDADSVIRLANRRVCDTFGLGEDAMVGRPVAEVFGPLLEDGGRGLRRQLAQTAAGSSTQFELGVQDASGRPLHVLVSASLLEDGSGGREGWLFMVSDITARKALEEQLVEQARTDALTGLGNRVHLHDTADRALALGGAAALLFCDLDGFKAVNDAFGHTVGDALLREVGQRLESCVRPGDQVTRIGGDEFAVLLPGVRTAADAEVVAERMRAALAVPLRTQDRELYVQASIGIAVASSGDEVEQLLRNADLAMYAAKGSGRGLQRVFEPDMHEAVSRRLHLEQDLRSAIELGELVVHYQPIVRLSDRRCVGVEALVRWTHRRYGPLSPDEFVPVAEEAGLIGDLERHVLTTAARDAAVLGERHEPFTVSVNMSARHLVEGTATADVVAALAAAGLPANRLMLEITERSLLAGELARSTVQELHRLGCLLALDDFGTGYSSIAHLRDFPVDVLKLDRTYVSSMTDDLHAARLVHAILQLAETLDISTTAEGVETGAQARILGSAGCTYGQGYLWAPALSVGELDRWLSDRSLPRQREPVEEQAPYGS